jgi:hypothetical protein
MQKLIRWLRRANEMAKRRAEIILAARNLLAGIDPKWRPQTGNSGDDVTLMLMRIGLAHLEALYQGQKVAEAMISRGEASRNQDAAHLN